MVPSHFNATPANVPPRAVQGRRRYARTRCRSSIPTTSRPLPRFSGGGSWAEPLWKTAHKRIPAEGVSLEAPPSWSRLHPLVPGVFLFRARVILRTDGPTRPIPRLPVRGKVRPFPHPEPPLLSSASGWVALSVGTHARCHARAFLAWCCRVPWGRATILISMLYATPQGLPKGQTSVRPLRLCASRFWLRPRAALGHWRGSRFKDRQSVVCGR
jgi:hypothetical protein